MNRSTNQTRTIRCPGCSGPSVYAPDNPYRPFCSARCKNNDFGAWASETYAVPAAPADPSGSGLPENTSGHDSTQH